MHIPNSGHGGLMFVPDPGSDLFVLELAELRGAGIYAKWQGTIMVQVDPEFAPKLRNTAREDRAGAWLRHERPRLEAERDRLAAGIADDAGGVLLHSGGKSCEERLALVGAVERGDLRATIYTLDEWRCIIFRSPAAMLDALRADLLRRLKLHAGVRVLTVADHGPLLPGEQGYERGGSALHIRIPFALCGLERDVAEDEVDALHRVDELLAGWGSPPGDDGESRLMLAFEAGRAVERAGVRLAEPHARRGRASHPAGAAIPARKRKATVRRAERREELIGMARTALGELDQEYRDKVKGALRPIGSRRLVTYDALIHRLHSLSKLSGARLKKLVTKAVLVNAGLRLA